MDQSVIHSTWQNSWWQARREPQRGPGNQSRAALPITTSFQLKQISILPPFVSWKIGDWSLTGLAGSWACSCYPALLWHFLWCRHRGTVHTIESWFTYRYLCCRVCLGIWQWRVAVDETAAHQRCRCRDRSTTVRGWNVETGRHRVHQRRRPSREVEFNAGLRDAPVIW